MSKTLSGQARRTMIDKCFAQLGVDFAIDEKGWLCVECFRPDDFYVDDEQKYAHERRYAARIIVQHGSHTFYFRNIYEVLFWYRYYTLRKCRIKRRISSRPRLNTTSCRNQAYFSRIPSYYRTISRKEGLNVVKTAFEQVFTMHGGIPDDYDGTFLGRLYTIRTEE